MILLPGRSSSWSGGGGILTDAEMDTLVSGDADGGMWVPDTLSQFITDPTFTTGVSNWSAVGDVSIAHISGEMELTWGSGGFPSAVYTAGWATTIGKLYQVQATVTSGTGLYIIKSDSAATFATNQVNIAAGVGSGTYRGHFTATATTTYLHCTISSGTATFDNIRVFEVDSGYAAPTSSTAPIMVEGTPGYATAEDGDSLTATTTGTADFNVFLRVSTSDTSTVGAYFGSSADWAGYWENASGASPHANVGTPTYYIDGGSALSSPTAGDLNTNISTGVPVTMEIRGINAGSATEFSPFGLVNMVGTIIGVVWGPTSLFDTGTNRADVLAYLESKDP